MRRERGGWSDVRSLSGAPVEVVAARGKTLLATRIQMELNPQLHILYAGACTGESFTDAFRTTDLSPTGPWLEDSLDTLKRFPLDRIDWGLSNSHRKDLVLAGPGRGYRRNGTVLPVDERHFDYWNHDPFRLHTGGEGLRLADGAAFTLPYYLGLYSKQFGE